MANKLYDIHMHTMDLSHVNLLAFLSREDLLSKENIGSLISKLPFVPIRLLFKLFPKKVVNKIKEGLAEAHQVKNLLAVIESSIEYDFLMIDYFLKNREAFVADDNTFTIDGVTYDKIVLCPLVMDFGYKNITDEHVFYNLPPRKPIQAQVIDLFNAVKKYFTHECIADPNSRTGIDYVFSENLEKTSKLFEIYPFLGINTQNYRLDQIETMIEKYFGGYGSDNHESRERRLHAKMGDFPGTLDLKGFDYTGLFAGIKVYPPLGFDPWPENSPKELEKVRFLYNACCNNNLPLTTHCSDGGFVASEHAREYTNPGNKWIKVLSEYPTLKLNFAHMGSQANRENVWQQQILNLICNEEYANIYTDFSCCGKSTDDYTVLQKVIERSKNPELLGKRILFGTDFMINLLWVESYNAYLRFFSENEVLKNKEILCSTNPQTFLFG